MAVHPRHVSDAHLTSEAEPCKPELCPVLLPAPTSRKKAPPIPSFYVFSPRACIITVFRLSVLVLSIPPTPHAQPLHEAGQGRLELSYARWMGRKTLRV